MLDHQQEQQILGQIYSQSHYQTPFHHNNHSTKYQQNTQIHHPIHPQHTTFSYMRQLKLEAQENRIIHRNHEKTEYEEGNKYETQDNFSKTPFQNRRIKQKTILQYKRQKIKFKKQRARVIKENKSNLLMVKGLINGQSNSQSFIQREIKRIKQGIKNMKQQQSKLQIKQQKPNQLQDQRQWPKLHSKINNYDDRSIYNTQMRQKHNYSSFQKRNSLQNCSSKHINSVNSNFSINKIHSKQHTKSILSKLNIRQKIPKRYIDFTSMMKIQSFGKINQSPKIKSSSANNSKINIVKYNSFSPVKSRIKCKTVHINDSRNYNRSAEMNKFADIGNQISAWNHINDHQFIF